MEDAINVSEVPEYLIKCNRQIDDIVEVVRGVLSPGATITIEALVVLDVHGKYHTQTIISLLHTPKHITTNTSFDKMAYIKEISFLIGFTNNTHTHTNGA